MHLSMLVLCTLASGVTAMGCGGSDSDLGSAPELGSAQAALIDEQCEFFDVDGHVQICHHTDSAKHPYTIIKTSEQGCIDGHAGHPEDYVAVGDPTCQGGGCLPETAPCDATLPCCDGLTCQDGTCVSLPPPPSCPCAGQPAWDNVISVPAVWCDIGPDSIEFLAPGADLESRVLPFGCSVIDRFGNHAFAPILSRADFEVCVAQVQTVACP